MKWKMTPPLVMWVENVTDQDMEIWRKSRFDKKEVHLLNNKDDWAPAENRAKNKARVPGA